MSDAPLIEIRNATIWRGDTRVFDNLDLVIEQHECVAILGPNGSGKTTLLKTITRELYPVAKGGTAIRILGRERWNVWELREHIGIVSHDLHHRYTPATTAIEVVVSGFFSSIGVHGTLARRISSDLMERSRATLERLGIGDLADRPLRALSTGQQRRCLLGLAASFDYLDRIRGLATSGHNIVLVTHHLNEIPPEVARVILLREGRIIADGPKAQVLDAALLSSVYDAAIQVAEVDGYYLAYPG